MPASLQQREGSLGPSEGLQNNTPGCDCCEKIFSTTFTTKFLSCPAGYHSLLCALCRWEGAAGQSTLHPWAHRHSLSVEKQSQRHPRCSEKVRVTEKALQEEQLCQLDTRKGFRCPWQAWDCEPSWLGSPYISPWEMSWRQ